MLVLPKEKRTATEDVRVKEEICFAAANVNVEQKINLAETGYLYSRKFNSTIKSRIVF